MEKTASSIPACRSPSSANLAGTVAMVKSRGSTASISSQVIGVDTVGSIYKYYFEHREMPPEDQIHQYLIDGIGEDFMPSCVWWDYIDGIVTIDDKTAYRATLDLATQESIFVGSSSGAAAAGARQIAESAGGLFGLRIPGMTRPATSPAAAMAPFMVAPPPPPATPAPPREAAAKKAPARKSPAKKAPPRKAAAKKAPARKKPSAKRS